VVEFDPVGTVTLDGICTGNPLLERETAYEVAVALFKDRVQLLTAPVISVAG
jgi:hypothetical protein